MWQEAWMNGLHCLQDHLPLVLPEDALLKQVLDGEAVLFQLLQTPGDRHGERERQRSSGVLNAVLNPLNCHAEVIAIHYTVL